MIASHRIGWHPVHKLDERYFGRTDRKYRIRRYAPGEFVTDLYTPLVSTAPWGYKAKLDTVIVRRYRSRRYQLGLSLAGMTIANSDDAIAAFLVGRGLNARTLTDWRAP